MPRRATAIEAPEPAISHRRAVCGDRSGGLDAGRSALDSFSFKSTSIINSLPAPEINN